MKFDFPPADGTRRNSEADKLAIKFCIDQIDEYRRWFTFNEKSWIFWQALTIVSGVVATIFGALTWPDGWKEFSFLRSVPAGIATIAAGIVASFTYREDAVRHEMTRNSLNGELAKVLSGAAPYNKTDDDDRSVFVNTICRLIDIEQRNWSELVNKNRSKTSQPHT